MQRQLFFVSHLCIAYNSEFIVVAKKYCLLLKKYPELIGYCSKIYDDS